MWLHIVIFMVTAAAALCKEQHLPEGIRGTGAKKLFVMVALAGNLLGMVLTLTDPGGQVYPEEYALKKEEDSYEEKFLVSVDGEETGNLYVQVPEKEMEEKPDEQETVELTTGQRLLDAVAEYNEQKADDDYYYLPSHWDEKKLEWESPKENGGTLLAALFFLTAFCLVALKARERQAEVAKRYEELLIDYPGMIMKFTLLVQAGMTVRKAFQKMAVDYRRKKSEKPQIAYEEIVIVCREMESGVSELEAYRRFGERCGQVKYKIFATLLIQNLQKGSRHLSEMLEKESMEAWDDRKRKARVLGEAATTKLLVPMILMLTVVIAIIMIPAGLSFYG